MNKTHKRWKDMLVGGVIAASLVATMGTALATTGSRNVRVDYSDIKLVVNGQTVTPRDADGNVVEPFTIDGTTYLPVRAVGNALDMDVDWNGTTRTVTLTDRTAGTNTNTNTGTNNSYIGEEKAKQIALDHAGLTASQVVFVRSHLDWDDGRAEYEVEFYANGTEYDYDIDAITGNIRSYDYDAEYYTPNSGSPSTGSYIGEEKAKQIALDHAGLSASAVTFVRSHLDWDDGRAEYEVEFYANGTEYDYDIDAVTGNIRSYDYDAEYYTAPSQNGATITEERVKEIVRERSGEPNGTFSRIELDWDDGRLTYEGDYFCGWYEYEFEVDASTGNIISWERD